MKRLLDVSGGFALSALLTPLIGVLALVSAIQFRAWPFFLQPRAGRNGATFRVVKIRSLPTHAPTWADKHQLTHVTTSRFGRFIRGKHLDELPQLWLVVTGQMSLVGPRPEMHHILERFDAHHTAVRARFRPGCTGLWQISVASGGMMYEAPEFDLFYAQHHCLRMDLWILWRTALGAVGGNAITLACVPRWVCAGQPVSKDELMAELSSRAMPIEEPTG